MEEKFSRLFLGPTLFEVRPQALYGQFNKSQLRFKFA
jgi:hypothetical protein